MDHIDHVPFLDLNEVLSDDESTQPMPPHQQEEQPPPPPPPPQLEQPLSPLIWAGADSEDEQEQEPNPPPPPAAAAAAARTPRSRVHSPPQEQNNKSNTSPHLPLMVTQEVIEIHDSDNEDNEEDNRSVIFVNPGQEQQHPHQPDINARVARDTTTAVADAIAASAARKMKLQDQLRKVDAASRTVALHLHRARALTTVLNDRRLVKSITFAYPPSRWATERLRHEHLAHKLRSYSRIWNKSLAPHGPDDKRTHERRFYEMLLPRSDEDALARQHWRYQMDGKPQFPRKMPRYKRRLVSRTPRELERALRYHYRVQVVLPVPTRK